MFSDNNFSVVYLGTFFPELPFGDPKESIHNLQAQTHRRKLGLSTLSKGTEVIRRYFKHSNFPVSKSLLLEIEPITF